MTAYIAYPPTIPEGVQRLFFSVTVRGALWKFTFSWIDEESRWKCYVDLPTGELREAGLYVDTENWKGFNDYGLMFHIEDKDTIGLSDLGSCAIYIVYKKEE